MDKFVIIDGNSLINRAFYALPLLSNSKGEFSNGVYGFANILIKAILEIKPKYIAVALDYGKKTFRNDIFEGYKAKRKPTPSELVMQFPLLRKMLSAMNIKFVEREGIEADDIIATLTKKFNTQNIVITGDKDSLQLINNTTTVWLTKKGITEVKIMDELAYNEEYGLVPSQVVDLKALMGDSSDNIPGVPGIGEKTALTLMQTYGSLDNIYNNLALLKPRQSELLKSGKELAYLSQKLAQSVFDVPIEADLKDFEYSFPFDQNVYNFFSEYQFNSLLKKSDLFANALSQTPQNKFNANLIEISSIEMLETQLKHIKSAGVLAFDLTNENFCFAYDINCEFVVPVQNTLTSTFTIEDVFAKMKEIFEDKTISKIAYDKKLMKHLLSQFSISALNINFDALLAFYLLTAGERNATKSDLFSFFGLNSKFCAVNLIYLKNELLNLLNEANLQKLYNEIEFPLIDVLFDMEQVGFKIDKQIYLELKDRYSNEVSDLEKTIIRLAGHNFNVNSPKQLSVVLFDELKLNSANNKKRSTNSDVLETLQDLHPIIPAIIRYRKISKFLTTYVEPYGELLDKNENIIHTVFNQTMTATGRLSSSKPNLQNIPVRDDEGKTLRKMFVSRFEDGMLVSADYSQIELRLLAHACGDENMINAFNNGIDIHSSTASEIFDVPIQEVTPLMRRTAKATNFGIIYGISEFGLSQNINSSWKQAKNFIEKYFAKYPKIKQYMDENVNKAKQTGFACSMFGRRRKVVELKSPNFQTRQFGERIAMNMPLQGTASDIIKLAMINVSKYLAEHKMKSKLILQVHDELIIDCVREEIVAVAKMLKQIMENVVTLSIPLTVDVHSGKTWFDC